MIYRIAKKTCIISVLLLCFTAAAPAAGPAPAQRLKNDGKLSLYSYHEREYLEVVYKDKKGYKPEALKAIDHLMRSRGDGTETEIDTRLIELIDHLQDRFGADTVEIISGYRSPAYNRSLILKGHGVAGESLHQFGMAADIHIDEIREKELADYASSLKVGGVGFYPRYLFVHVDVGVPHRWSEAMPAERILSGTENNPNTAWTAITDRNEYARGDPVSVAVTNNGYEKQKLAKNFWIEHFRRGKWEEQKKIDVDGDAVSLSPGESAKYSWKPSDDAPFGKYRFVIFTSRDFSIPPANSNEFYIKR